MTSTPHREPFDWERIRGPITRAAVKRWIVGVGLQRDEEEALNYLLESLPRIQEQLQTAERERDEAKRMLDEQWPNLLGGLREQLEAEQATLVKIRAAAERQVEGEYQPGWLSCSWLIDVIGNSNPASEPEPCRYCAGKGGRHRAVASRFLGTEPQVHDGPWETCSFCGGSGVAADDAPASRQED